MSGMIAHEQYQTISLCRYYRGRGAFESMGAGIDMAPGDIAFKCNFATLDVASNIVIKRRADRHFEDVGPILCAALDGECKPALLLFFLQSHSS